MRCATRLLLFHCVPDTMWSANNTFTERSCSSLSDASVALTLPAGASCAPSEAGCCCSSDRWCGCCPGEGARKGGGARKRQRAQARRAGRRNAEVQRIAARRGDARGWARRVQRQRTRAAQRRGCCDAHASQGRGRGERTSCASNCAACSCSCSAPGAPRAGCATKPPPPPCGSGPSVSVACARAGANRYAARTGCACRPVTPAQAAATSSAASAAPLLRRRAIVRRPACSRPKSAPAPQHDLAQQRTAVGCVRSCETARGEPGFGAPATSAPRARRGTGLGPTTLLPLSARRVGPAQPHAPRPGHAFVMTPLRAPPAVAARLSSPRASSAFRPAPRAPPRPMRRHADQHGGGEGSGDEEHGHAQQSHGVVKRDVTHALRQRTPSPDVGDDTLGWRRTPDASGEELLRSRVRCTAQRSRGAHCAAAPRPGGGFAAPR